jgi:hypothetical protein
MVTGKPETDAYDAYLSHLASIMESKSLGKIRAIFIRDERL